MADAELDIIKKIHGVLSSRSLRLALAESCTGGFLSRVVLSFDRSDEFFEASVICNTASSLNRLLGVGSSLIEEHGLVSEETARAMARGAAKAAGAGVALAVACNPRPSPEAQGNPGERRNPGLVYVAVTAGDAVTSKGFIFDGPPEEIMRSATSFSLHFLYEAISVWA